MALDTVTASTGTTLKAPGCYVIAAPSADKTWQIAAPTNGAELTVLVDTNSTKVVTLQAESSAVTFFGSTADRMAVSTGQACVRLEFTGVSTSQWAFGVASKSTAAPVTLSGSTR